MVCPPLKALPGRGHLGDQSPRSAPILVCGRAAGRDRDGRDQTMSCIHGGLGQSQGGASRPRAAPPATARARENPASGQPSAAIPGQGAPRSNCAPPTGGDPWCGRRGVPSGHGSRTEGRTHRPFRLELGAVPLRRASSRGREERRRPRRGGQRHPGYRAGDDDGPSGSSQSLRDARLAPARERRRVKGWGGPSGPRESPARVHPRRRPPPPRGRPSPDAEAGTRVTDASPAGPRRARPLRGPPHLLRVHRGGAPGRQPISAGRPGTASEVLAGGGAGGRTSWGARRSRAGGEKQECGRGWEARLAVVRLRS